MVIERLKAEGDFWECTGKGFLSGAINAGVSMIAVPGIITNGLLTAGTNVLGNGISNLIYGDDFLDNWAFAAGSGFAAGALSGYNLSKEGGLNYWWGTKSENWGHNRSQWSLAWWDKPNRVQFSEVKNHGIAYSPYNCKIYACWNAYGGEVGSWDCVGDMNDWELLDVLPSNNRYPITKDISWADIEKLHQNGGRGMVSFENYWREGEGHLMAVKAAKFIPEKYLKIKVFDSYNGKTYWIDFLQETNRQGTNRRFWSLY